MLMLEPDGLRVLWDMDRVHPACRGSMELHFKVAITDTNLERFPIRRMTFNVDPQSVIRFVGSRRRLPRG
jgi:hypothetical protein